MIDNRNRKISGAGYSLYFKLTMTFIFAAVLGGCASGDVPDATTTPVLDQEFGSTLKTALDAQRIPVDPKTLNSTVKVGDVEVRDAYKNHLVGKSSSFPSIQAPVSNGVGGQ